MSVKKLHLNLEPFEINGVVHVGADTGQFAGYYHSLGIHKVLWIERQGHKYGSLYANTCRYGMKQRIINAHLHDHDDPPSVKKFITLWRQNAAYIDIDTYDMLHIVSRSNRKEILNGFEFLLAGFNLIVFSNSNDSDIEELESLLDAQGFKLDCHAEGEEVNEYLFVRKNP